MHLAVQQAQTVDIQDILDILFEVSEWLRQRGIPMWGAGELDPESISRDVASGEFFLCKANGKTAGVVKFQLEDPLFWPDTLVGEAAFVHRLAVRRCHSGGNISRFLLMWAAERARGLGRQFLRLDCDAKRHRLRAVYERAGFRYHSDKQAGAYFVSRYELPLF